VTQTSIATADAVSPDSGAHWTAEGAWQVAEGIHRIPLPLPGDALRAVNVYVLETGDGLTMIDGGWAIDGARATLDRSLRKLGGGLKDIRRFLVTHVHRDHYTMAAVLSEEVGASITLGAGERSALDLLNLDEWPGQSPFARLLVRAGAIDLAARWSRNARPPRDPAQWRYPDTWLEGDCTIQVGQRTLDAVHTPGHTPGHYVFADRDAGLLFAGDHVLPTITPSIGFTVPASPDPLGAFMASLIKLRAMPDLAVLPAHGPLTPSVHARVDELLTHHERRLTQSLDALSKGPATGFELAHELTWTRHERCFDELDTFNQALAARETKAHLDLLVARGRATRSETPDGAVTFTALESPSPTAPADRREHDQRSQG
jgi:glyoxylase-like metal-dependent hydrolase (beta-lactamase superfamily II)